MSCTYFLIVQIVFKWLILNIIRFALKRFLNVYDKSIHRFEKIWKEFRISVSGSFKLTAHVRAYVVKDLNTYLDCFRFFYSTVT